ncbi:MAG: hypothetical protein JWQ07_4426 [Ramlibacter sp.]|nr:hypothetical protein [Ramlibacter sp.]
MGKKGPMGMVAPAEFRTRTSVIGRRNGPITKVDTAYDTYFAGRTEENANRLHQELQGYLVGHGGYWSKIPRDKESGGLLKWLYEFTTPRTPIGPVTLAQSQDQRAIRAIASHDIPHSRFGVLYLFGNIDIDMNKWSIALEGVAAVGSAVGGAVSTNYNHLDSDKLSTKNFDMGAIKDIKGGDMADALGVPFTIASKPTNITGTSMPTDTRYRTRQVAGPLRQLPGPVRPGEQRPLEQRDFHVERIAKAPRRELPGFPATGAMFEAIADDPLLMLNPYTLAGTIVGTTVAVLYDAFNNLRVLLINAVTDLFNWIKAKLLSDGEWAWDVSASLISKAVKFVVGKCLEAAAPFIGGAMDLGGGIIKTIKAAKERLETWMMRRKIVLNPGHPEEAANAIEANMTKGIFEGLWSVLKGVASLSLSALLPGAGSLVAALVTGVEWLVKLVWRIWEQSKISKFLKLAREHYKEEKRLAEMNAMAIRLTNPGEHGMTGSRNQLVPEMDRSKGGIIHDLDRFKAFYKKGCDASPLIPMLTFNTGICGSLMVLMRMFDDADTMITQATWDTGAEYFTKLKQYGRGYLSGAGFEFKPLEAGNKSIQGLLNHAVQHHTSISSKMDKALAFGAGFAG